MDATQPEHNPELVADIDFDKTITVEHIHNILFASGETDSDKQWELVKHVKPINSEGKEDEWQKAFETLLKQGVYIAILTFSAYPHIIKRYLIEILKINPVFFDENKIVIIAFYRNLKNKNTHILEGLKAFGLPANFSKESTILVDDDKQNIFAASLAGYPHVILATPNGKHIAALLSKVAELQKPVSNTQKENILSSSSAAELLPQSVEKFYETTRDGTVNPTPDQEPNPLKTSAENMQLKLN